MKKTAGHSIFAATAFAVGFVAAPTMAQSSDGAVGREVVQPLPSQEVQRLNNALGRLARNSRNLDALTDAGQASLELGDLDAALGFFGRAQDIAPGNARVKMGMAAVFLRSDRPIEALRLFSEAEAAGASSIAVSAERGLAYDLVGNNGQAQQSYGIALQRGAGADVKRRLAISHAIAGNKEDFEIVLQPLVANRDFAAFRARAFGLAILGEADEATAIADAVMPRDLAARMAPYLAYMPRLTKAQQAAAANLGIFPKAADIGRDNPRIAQYANAGPATAADALLEPRGAPLGRATTDDRRRRPDRTGSGSQIANASETPVEAPAAQAQLAENAELPATKTTAPAVAQVSAPVVQEVQVAQAEATEAEVATVPAVAAAEEISVQEEVRPAQATLAQAIPTQAAPAEVTSSKAAPAPEGSTFDLADTTPERTNQEVVAEAEVEAGVGETPAQVATVAETVAAPVVQSTPPAERAIAARQSVTDAFADFASQGRTSVEPAVGAVDISTIAVQREPKPEPPKAESETQEPEHPKRFWVQIASVKNRSAMASEYRRIARKADGLLKGYAAHGAEWGETNRLLAGPLPSSKRATELVSKLKEAGVDSFVHTSAEGKKVDKLQ